VFILCTLALAVLYALKVRETNSSDAFIRPRIVSASVETTYAPIVGEADEAEADAALISFIPLRSNERLIQTLSIDFNGDGYDDQINAVKRDPQAPVMLLAGIYDPRQNSYVRAAEIDTEISQDSSFSYTSMDVTGDHRNALVYQGMSANGDTVMQIFLGMGQAANFRLASIGNFRTNGNIFIQQVDRYDAYETSQASGISFPVWVYSVDTGQANSLDQLQTLYEWNPLAQRYVQSRQTRIAGQRLAGTELARLQDGTIETLAAYLNGLWYQSVNDTVVGRYIYFDYSSKEIIFIYEDMQEVYSWNRSVLRRAGVYLSTVNTSISNLARQFDVSLTASDEITVRVQDDVRMNIGENSLWDGVYKKMTQSAGMQPARENSAAVMLTALTDQSQWNLSDGAAKMQFSGGTYTLTSDSIDEHGRHTVALVNGKSVIQFRPETPSAILETAYVVSKNTGPEGSDFYLMEPVALAPSGYIKTGKASIRLEPVDN
jgi:hypothetical protein